MLRYFFQKMLLTLQKRYNYDVTYQQDMLQCDLAAYLKFMAFQTMSAHSAHLPAASLFAARIRAIIWEDCGPCSQLVVNMALEAKVPPDLVQAIIEKNLTQLPDDVALVVQFSDLVLAHNPDADDLREQIRVLWGQPAVVTIAFAISSYRVYPALKYSLGYGKACNRIQINDSAITPKRV